MAIKNRLDNSSSIIDINIDLPKITDGINGELSFNLTNKGINLYGKVNDNWYQIGNASLVNAKGKVDKKKSSEIVGKETSINRDTDKFCMFDSGVVKYVSGTDLRTYIGAGTSSIAFDGSTSSGVCTYKDADEMTVESEITYGASGLSIIRAGVIQQKLGYDGSNYAYFSVENDGGLTLTNTGTDAHIALDAHKALELTAMGGAATLSGSSVVLNSSTDIELNADGGQVEIKDDDTSHFLFDCDATTFTIYDDTDAADLFYIRVSASGATTIATMDDGAAVGHLTLAPDGNLNIDAETEILSEVPLKIKESADAVADTAGYGQLWVDTATPNELAFTDDAGTDIIGIGKYHYETKINNFNATSGTSFYLPLAGYIIEGTATVNRNEYQAMIAPYNGTIEKFAWRSEFTQGVGSGTMRFVIAESSDGTEIPGTIVFRKDLSGLGIADDTYTEYDLTSPGTGTFPIPLTKGRIYMINWTTAAAPGDTNTILVFKWDITS